MICKTDICLTSDGRLCLISDTDSVVMLHGAGAEITDERASELGVLGNPIFDASMHIDTKVIECAPENKKLRIQRGRPKGKKSN